MGKLLLIASNFSIIGEQMVILALSENFNFVVNSRRKRLSSSDIGICV